MWTTRLHLPSWSRLGRTKGPRELSESAGAFSKVPNMSVSIEELEWRAGALCSRFDPDLWFSPGALEHKEAKRICRSCPVRRECLSYALDTPVDHGVWG